MIVREVLTLLSDRGFGLEKIFALPCFYHKRIVLAVKCNLRVKNTQSNYIHTFICFFKGFTDKKKSPQR